MRLLAPISALLLLAGMSTGLLAMQRGGSNKVSYDEYGAREAFSSADNDNGKNEYSWSRLRYSMAGAAWRRLWVWAVRDVVARLSQGRPAIPDRAETADAHQRAPRRAGGGPRQPRGRKASKIFRGSTPCRCRPGRSPSRGQAAARISAQGRLPDGGRFPWGRPTGNTS